MTELKIALLQLRTPDSQEAAIRHCMPLLQRAAEGGANLILLPEASNIVQRDPVLLAGRSSTLNEDVFVKAVRAFAAKENIWVLLGSVIIRGNERARNRALLLASDGTIAATYDKIHLYDVDLPNGERYRESARYEPGDALTVAETPWGGLGLSICYDLRFPELYRDLSLFGSKMLAVGAAFAPVTGQAHWEALLRARAVENGAFVLAPAQGGFHADGSYSWGHSMVVNPWGEIIAALEDDEPAVLFATIDLCEVETARHSIPSLAHRRVYRLPDSPL